MLADLWRDVRLAVRGLRKAPMFTFVAVVTLAVGIGANTAVFSALRALVLEPLPYPHADRLVVIRRELVKRAIPFYLANPADLVDYRAAKGFEEIQGFLGATAMLTDGGEAERITIGMTTPGLFAMLGAAPALGRAFTPEEGRPLDPSRRATYVAPVMLSYEFWTRRFGADPNVIGRTIHFGFGARGPKIIGVLPKGFRIITSGQSELETDHPDVWGTWVLDSANPVRNGYDLYTIGKLKPGVTVSQADQQVEAISRRQREQFPDYAARGIRAYVVPLQQDVGAHVRPMLFALLGAVGFVLLIACVNVANLLLVRAVGRAREMSIRAALGGGRARIVRQLLAEAGVLAGVGGVAGVALAGAMLPAVSRLVPADVPRLGAFTLDPAALGFSLLATGLAATVFGLYPALRASRTDLMGVLRGRATEGRHGARTRLVVVEVALSFVLVVGAGLMVRSFVALRNADPEFRPEGVLTFTANLPSEMRAEDERLQVKARLQRRLEAIPGVVSASAGIAAPLDGNILQGPYGNEATVAAGGEDAYRQAWYRSALPGYFKTLGTPLVEGRAFTAAEQNDSTNHIVVDQRVARANWPGQSAVGKRLYVKFLGGRAWYDVVGVVADQRQASLVGESQGTIWFPDRTWGSPSGDKWEVRVKGNPAAFGSAVRAAVRAVDDHIIVDDMHPLTDLVTRAEAPTALVLKIASVFGGMALLLAVVGLYGVIAYLVRERTGEFGLRMALGSGRDGIFRIVLRQGAILATVGIGIGIAGALVLTRLMRSVLVGVAPDDPLTLLAVAGVFVVVAVAACLVPAVRAVRVDPMVALRSD